MNNERFRELVEEAVDSLPAEFAQKLNNVAVVVEDSPSDDLSRELGLSQRDLLFGLSDKALKRK